ncbi:MAG: type II toxin-antitoxin system RelE/ParE family toxin [Planctomycetes bacterium]|nr:type II toxin-antitoxin system RelE/ParE family toxin [Planctomycetota bacterium]
MAFEIVFAPEADDDARRLTAREWAMVRDGIHVHLRHEPERTSKSRIKRLRGLERPRYRLRIDEFRVFYDVKEGTVEVLAIVPKSQAAQWLEEKGIPT